MSRANTLSLMLLITVTLAGCGGGGGGGGGSGGGGGGGGGSTVTGISLSPGTMSFTANHDDPDAPPAQTVTITALGTGTTYIRFENGLATGLTCNGTSSCTFPVRPTDAPYNFVSPATSTNGITFIGCADQTCTTGPVPNGRQTLTYTYTVTPGLDIAPGGALNVTGVEGVPTPPQTLTLTHPSGTVPPWQATFVPTGAGPAFVTLSPATAATPNSATLQAQFATLPAGTYTGTIEVQPGTSPRRVKRDVTYTVQSALRVTGNMSFVIDSTTQGPALQQTWAAATSPGVTGSLDWIATVDAPWAQLSRTNGDTGSASQIVVSLLPAKLERLPKGLYNATVRFFPTAGSTFAIVQVPVSLDMRLPHTEFVMPRAVSEGSIGETFTRGSGFTSLAGTVNFGGASATSATRESDTFIRANHPPLASGDYKIDLTIPTNNLGLNRERARLAVTNTSALTAADIPSSGTKYSLVFDDARLTLYIANVGTISPPNPSSLLQRLTWNGSSWAVMPDTMFLGVLRDIVLTPGGDELLALTPGAVVRVDPDNWGSIIGTVPTLAFGVPNRSLGVGNDGRLVISLSDAGATNTNVLYYDLFDGSSANEFVCCISGNIRASGDGTVLYLLGDTNTHRYDVKTRTYTHNSTTGGASLSVSRTGARFLVDGTRVYNSDFTSWGTLAAGETLTAGVITSDGNRAYAYADSGKLYTFDLETFTGPGNFTQIGAPITLPHSAGAAPVMTVSVDGRTVFIAGDDRVIVKPVGP